MKAACGPDVHMKSILAIGELGSMSNVYKASLVCMMAGSDFIKYVIIDFISFLALIIIFCCSSYYLRKD